VTADELGPDALVLLKAGGALEPLSIHGEDSVSHLEA
jgi:hypothetical protein